MDLLLNNENVIVDFGICHIDNEYIIVVKENNNAIYMKNGHKIEYNIDINLIFEKQKHLYINGIIRDNPKYANIL